MNRIIQQYMLAKAWWKLRRYFSIKKIPIERLGSAYGGWVVPKGVLNSKSVCYCAGAGEDISFDLLLAEKYECEVHIFDPTPRAVEHFKKAESAMRQRKAMSIYNGAWAYPATPKVLEMVQFHEWGIWDRDSVLRFYTPADPSHVSHSAVNLQKTDQYFEAQVYSTQQLMGKLGHQQIDMLKIDIEGAEYTVMNNLLSEGLYPKILCVEFDEVNHPQDENALLRMREALEAWIERGYDLVHQDEFFNSTLVRRT